MDREEEENFWRELVAGNPRFLAKAITLIESELAKDRDCAQRLLRRALPYQGRALRLAISGVPGAGKSSFINILALEALRVDPDLKIAVLSIDPSSSLSRGSLMGDKLRMPGLINHPRVFIRPSSSGGMLGGITRASGDIISLLEASGYSFIFIETVGVGQNESEASSICDFFLLLHLPKSGDEVQGIKKGVYELADLVVVHKADGELLNAAKADVLMLKNAQSHKLIAHARPVFSCSSKTGDGSKEVWQEILQTLKNWEQDGTLKVRREEQSLARLRTQTFEFWSEKLQKHPNFSSLLAKFSALVRSGQLTYREAALQILLEIELYLRVNSN